MTHRVVWTKEAESDLEHIIEYYLLEASEAVARAVGGRIRAGLAELAEFPLRTRSGRVGGTRECVIARLPYIGVVKIDASTVYVLAILHTARQYPPA